MMDLTRPLPEKTPLTAPFWEGLDEHRILVQYSPSSDQWVFYPRALAPGTLADDLEWREISGRGTLYTFTVTDRPVSPHFAAEVPQMLGIVEWPEGPRINTMLVNVDAGDLRVGMPVRPVFVPAGQGAVTLLCYEPGE